MKAPSVDYCVLCEDVRVEINGKGILLGFYGVLPHVEMRVNESGKINLVFVVSFGKAAKRKLKVTGRIINPDGSELRKSKERESDLGPGHRSNLILRFSGIAIIQEGIYTFDLQSDDGLIYQTTFSAVGAKQTTD